ncbi:hypothetical protein GCM10009610_36180 [Pseudonocardia xinjiangensis]
MCHLPGGVHARVRATRDGQRHGLPQHRRQRLGQHTAHGAPPRLDRPPGEVGAVVGEVEPEPPRVARLAPASRPFSGVEPARNAREPAVTEDGGLDGVVRVLRNYQDSSVESSSRCDRGSSNPAASAASGVANQTSGTVLS